MTIYDRINAGDYKPKMPYPSKPKEPDLFGKAVVNMSLEDLKLLPELHVAFEAQNIQYAEAKRQYAEEEARLDAKFWNDLFAEHSIPTDHPLAAWLRGKSYESGHSGGYSEIASHFSSLSEVVEIFDKELSKK